MGQRTRTVHEGGEGMMGELRKVAKWRGGEVAKGRLSHSATRPLGNCRGQSILEYLVIAAVIVAGILAIKGTVKTNTDKLYTNAANKVNAAAASLGNLGVEAPR